MRHATCEIISQPFSNREELESHGEIDVRIYFAGLAAIKFETDSQHPFAKAAVDALLAKYLGKTVEVAPGAAIHFKALIPHHIVELARKPKQLELDAEVNTGIRLECGKNYQRRDGRVVGPVERTPEQHPFAADFPYMIKQPEGCRTYLANGRNSTEREEPFDLIAEAATLKLEAGKWYRRRDGEVVGPLLDVAPAGWRPLSEEQPFGVLYNNTFRTYTPDGYWYATRNASGVDLLAEVPAPVLVPETQPTVAMTTLTLVNSITGERVLEDVDLKAFTAALTKQVATDTTTTDSPAAPLTDISALAHQEGGNHYKGLKIQPVEYIHANEIDYLEGNVIKYVTRHKQKNGKQDILKAIHYLQLILEMDYKNA